MERKQQYLDMTIGPLAIIGMRGTETLSGKIDAYLAEWRAQRHEDIGGGVELTGYARNSFLMPYSCPRFATGESKGVIERSVRGYDLFILVDCFNHSVTYDMYGSPTRMSPDDHFQDIKRIISAAGTRPRRINLIMPMLYEGRQDKRSGRESLDCAMMLTELNDMGIDNIITFDAHEPKVSNAIFHSGFENVSPAYQVLSSLLRNVEDITIDKSRLMVISPDTGAVTRAVYYSSMLGVDMGLFYKRRDYSRIVNGRNPIVAHEFLGDSVEGKDLIIVDDMISSGESSLDVAEKMKARGARRVFLCATFGLFTSGLTVFDKAYERGIVDKVLTTNLIYNAPELLERPWYVNVDMSKYIAYIIDNLNHDHSLSDLVDPAQRIHNLVTEYRAGKVK